MPPIGEPRRLDSAMIVTRRPPERCPLDFYYDGVRKTAQNCYPVSFSRAVRSEQKTKKFGAQVIGRH